MSEQGGGIGKEAVVIGNIVHMADHNGQIYLISAADRIKRRWPHVRICNRGDGELRGNWRQRPGNWPLMGYDFCRIQEGYPSILVSFDIFAFHLIWKDLEHPYWTLWL